MRGSCASSWPAFDWTTAATASTRCMCILVCALYAHNSPSNFAEGSVPNITIIFLVVLLAHSHVVAAVLETDLYKTSKADTRTSYGTEQTQ